MPYRKTFFEKYCPVHIISRAVDGKEIFGKEDDCYRFIFQICAANLGKPGFNMRKDDVIKTAKALLHGEKVSSKFLIEEHSPLVSILDFALVLNHYHIHLLANVENIIPIFIQKLNRGFVGYFNLKYNRKGPLFDGPYKSILIKTESQGVAVSRYVSIINPLDVYQPGWRETGLNNWYRAFRFLESFQFSSFPDKIENRKSKILADEEILEQYSFIGFGQKAFKIFVEEFLEERQSPSGNFYLE